MTQGTCKLTGVRGPLVKSHIIPRAFYLDRRGHKPNVPTILLGPSASTRPTRSPMGVYDRQLVTAEAEKIFQLYDDYGFKFLEKTVGQWTAIRDGYQSEPYGFEIWGLDNRKLRLFFLSLLWRAAASRRPEFSQIQLGEKERRLRNLVVSGDPGKKDEFPVIVRFFLEGKSRVPIFIPHMKVVSGARCICVILGGAEVLLDIESKYEELRDLYLPVRDGEPVQVLAGRFEANEMSGYVRKLVFDNIDKHGRSWTSPRAKKG